MMLIWATIAPLCLRRARHPGCTNSQAIRSERNGNTCLQQIKNDMKQVPNKQFVRKPRDATQCQDGANGIVVGSADSNAQVGRGGAASGDILVLDDTLLLNPWAGGEIALNLLQLSATRASLALRKPRMDEQPAFARVA